MAHNEKLEQRINDYLIVRVGVEAYADCLKKPYVVAMDITGKPMKGWIMVESLGFKVRSDLAHWLNAGLDFAATLPAKPAKVKNPKK